MTGAAPVTDDRLGRLATCSLSECCAGAEIALETAGGRSEIDTRVATAREELMAATTERDRAVAAEGVATRLAALETELAALVEVEAAARAQLVAATSERAAARQENPAHRHH